MISAIVLAAGYSTRMGSKNKMLLPFKGNTVIKTILNELTKSFADEIIVVTNNEDVLKNHITETNTKVKFTKNLRRQDGLTSSIQCGIKATNPRTIGFMICLGDMPLLLKSDYNLLINKFLDSKEEAILLPINMGKRGNPVIFSHHFLDQIMKLDSPDGCKPIVKSFPSYVVEVPVTTNHFFFDIDTEEDYEKVVI